MPSIEKLEKIRTAYKERRIIPIACFFWDLDREEETERTIEKINAAIDRRKAEAAERRRWKPQQIRKSTRSIILDK